MFRKGRLKEVRRIVCKHNTVRFFGPSGRVIEKENGESKFLCHDVVAVVEVIIPLISYITGHRFMQTPLQPEMEACVWLRDDEH